MVKCDSDVEEDRDIMTYSVACMMSVTIILGLVIMPVLLYHLKGVRRIIIVLQQLAILFHTSTFLVTHLFTNSALDEFEDDHETYFRQSSLLFRRRMASHAKHFFESFFNHLAFFLSFMQTIDVYKMVCEPFKYIEFARKEVVSKYIGMGICICIALNIEELIGVCVWAGSWAYNTSDDGFDGVAHFMELKNGVIFYILMYNVTKSFLVRIVFAIVVSRLAFLVRKSLLETSQVGGELTDEKKALYSRLFYFCLIPLFLNFLFLIPEVLFAVSNIFVSYRDDCFYPAFFRKKNVLMVVLQSSFALGSLTYYFAFIALFPAVRNTFLCTTRSVQ